MKLATYVYNGAESWGFVIKNPLDEDREWIFNPSKAEDMMKRAARINTASLRYSLSTAIGKVEWPATLMECLRLGPDAMDVLKQLCSYTEGYLRFGDKFAIRFAGVALENVKLLAPLPRTRLMLGMVRNCPAFWRNQFSFTNISMAPRLHQRPMTSTVGPGEKIAAAGGNVEMGIVIGKEGKNIPIEKAHEYIAGYTVVIDTENKGYFGKMEALQKSMGMEIAKPDPCWYNAGTASYLGKKSDCCCAMGPFIVTPEEVGNHYDLFTRTGHGGIMRDRAHTGAFSTGIERIISWYSSIATLYPGDVFHMGTAGTDGLFVDQDMFEENLTMESEIEKVGLLQVRTARYPNMTAEQKAAIVPPARKDFVKAGRARIASAQDWSLQQVNNVWMCMANNVNCEETDQVLPAVWPRIFNGPNTCVGWTGNPLVVNARATSLTISVQIAIVVKEIAKGITSDEVKDSILGYTPVISVADHSLWDEFFTDAKAKPDATVVNTYAHWGDGNNVVKTPVMLDSAANLKMKLSVEGYGEITGSTDEYSCSPEYVAEYLNDYITLLPGDVICLGRTCRTIEIPAGADIDGRRVSAEIEGLGQVTAVLQREKI